MAKSKTNSDLSKLKYDEAVAELETILDQIESGEVPLEEALAHSERGAALLKHCKGILDRVESRMAALVVDEDASEFADTDDVVDAMDDD